MLLSLMYHRIDTGKHSNSQRVMEEHLHYLKETCHAVHTGDDLHPEKINVCLVFDDATVDFFHFVYPLVQKLDLRVMMAVTVSVIPENEAGTPLTKRLEASSEEFLFGSAFKKINPYCNWDELRTMARSGLVKIASHSYHHQNLRAVANPADELLRSKTTLESRLQTTIDTIVYPYGDFNRTISSSAAAMYRYQIAVGAGDNKTWRGIDGILFRINADGMKTGRSLLDCPSLTYYRFAPIKLYLKKFIMDRKGFIPTSGSV
jgi:peptidoglycan/xylan/chitin deacetylase (PgdA/CDA1 family)